MKNPSLLISAPKTCLFQEDTKLTAHVYHTIWLVVQHAPYDKYMEQYINRCKE